ncbi:hypothetical protein D6829_00300 [Candidatus Pacearchaeota archaeon]|nr:MAG: hypothetical protein D6829_00300 [Candidatus Pacearchaeota archaeon]
MGVKRGLAYLLIVLAVVFLANFFSVQLTGYSVFHPIKSIFFQGGSLGPSALGPPAIATWAFVDSQDVSGIRHAGCNHCLVFDFVCVLIL